MKAETENFEAENGKKRELKQRTLYRKPKENGNREFLGRRGVKRRNFMNRGKRRKRDRLCSITVALSLSLGMAVPAFAASPPFAYTEEEWARLRDNVLEYDEIPNLIREYNVIVENNNETYRTYRGQKDSKEGREDLEKSAEKLLEQASDMEDMMAEPMMALFTNSYAQLLYAARSMESGALQIQQQVDSYTIDGPTLKLQFDNIEAMMAATAQDLMISHEKLLANEEMVKSTQELLCAVLESTKRQKEQGLATENDVLSAQMNVQNLEASLLQIQSGIKTIRQNLCLLTGWAYDAEPDIRPIPEPDLEYLESRNVAEDAKTALEKNHMHKYNLRVLENTTKDADKQNLQRTIEDEQKTIPQSLQELYDAAVQLRLEWEQAQTAVKTAEDNLAAIQRQKDVGMVGTLQFLQVKNAYDTAVSQEKTAKLSLFQEIEAYRRGVDGYLTQS